MTNVERYRAMLNCLEYNYKGIELCHIVTLKIWGEARGKRVFSWRHIICLFKAYDVRSFILPNDNGFLSTFMEKRRNDHYNLYETILSRFSISPTRNDLFNLKTRFVFNPLIISILCCHFFFKIKGSGLSIGKKLNWLSEYAFLCNTIHELEKIDFTPVKKYLSMCHIIGLENLLTQYFRQKGIETFSLEEGIYMVYKRTFVIGAIAYENFATDHLLCWGQYTKDQYIEYGIDASRIDVAGYPKSQTLKPQKQNNKYQKCLVMLAGPLFGDVNNNLLTMLGSLRDEIDITLKSHPVNYSEMETYAKKHTFSIIPKSQSIADCFENGDYDFSIAVNTTAYYESWMAGIPCIRYNDERFDNFYGFDDLFSTKEQLESLLCEYRSAPKNELEVKQMLEYAIGFGLDNYDSIING